MPKLQDACAEIRRKRNALLGSREGDVPMARPADPTAQAGLTMIARTRRLRRPWRPSRERALEHCLDQLAALRRGVSGGAGGCRGLPCERLAENVLALMSSDKTGHIAF
jgi:hypothetical protein